jgi:hypothetical protein
MTDDPATDAETLPNKERGCGFLKHSKAYIRSPPRSTDGVLPPFVEFDPYIPYLERNKFRGYEFFPGIPFELAVTGGHGLLDGMDDEDYGLEHISEDYDSVTSEDSFTDGTLRDLKEVDGGFETDPPGEVFRHIARLVGSATGDHAGDITAFHANDLYMHVGKSYYEDPGDFIREVRTQGLSKAIPVSESHAPPIINPGMTRVFLVHPRAIVDEDGDETAGIIGYVYLSRVVYTESKEGRFPNWAKDYARTGKLDLVQIGDQIYDDGTRASTIDEEDAFGSSEDDEPVDVEPSPAGTDEPCPYCGESNLREDARGVYCPACGKTLGDDPDEEGDA